MPECGARREKASGTIHSGCVRAHPAGRIGVADQRTATPHLQVITKPVQRIDDWGNLPPIGPECAITSHNVLVAMQSRKPKPGDSSARLMTHPRNGLTWV